MEHTHFLHCHLAGFTFWKGVFVFHKLEIGTELKLKAEPENQYDHNAVAVYFEDKKIGYIPRSQNREIAKFLQAGHTDIFDTRINRIDKSENPENQIGIVVFLKEK
ncbi:HIRAN domain-containing protein [Candidatus Gracilibacteria bacterium]|nr:HIRAN domain-containing protein [Candidatus Gracilibacteria bacterium]